MRHWLRGAPGGLAAFLLIAGLVAGGLGWATAAALRLEREQRQARAEAELAARVRLALWQLDSRLSPLLAREDSRPYNHYIALFRPPQMFVSRKGRLVPDDTVRELSPLLNAELPDWMVLHFQTDEESGWGSPQVPFRGLLEHLRKGKVPTTFRNVTANRARLLASLKRKLPARTLLAAVEQKGPPLSVPDRTVMLYPSNTVQMMAQGPQQGVDTNAQNRFAQQQKVQNDLSNGPYRDERESILNNIRQQGQNWLAPLGKKSAGSVEVGVSLSPMVPVWLTVGEGREYLLLVRQVRIEDSTWRACQGIVLDADKLRRLLAREIRELLPAASFAPVRERVAPNPERTMATLPFQLETGPGLLAVPEAGWTPLRIGLALAWAAALVALLAVGLGGWFLLDLSERRFRFVSAVTHELRTPLTTLRLYLDMLVNGLVRDERQKNEYLHTLHGETDRLSRLVTNVLDFSRLERQRPRLTLVRMSVDDLLARVRDTWQGRCHDAGKELILENGVPLTVLETDAELLQQVLANLIDNACKYSRDAEDSRIWLRVGTEKGWIFFEVEDSGPGVPARERRTIFRPFQRGRSVDATGGGVGLGLALARRWARMLGGRLTLRGGGSGACFRLELAAGKE